MDSTQRAPVIALASQSAARSSTQGGLAADRSAYLPQVVAMGGPAGIRHNSDADKVAGLLEQRVANSWDTTRLQQDDGLEPRSSCRFSGAYPH